MIVAAEAAASSLVWLQQGPSIDNIGMCVPINAQQAVAASSIGGLQAMPKWLRLPTKIPRQ